MSKTPISTVVIDGDGNALACLRYIARQTAEFKEQEVAPIKLTFVDPTDGSREVSSSVKILRQWATELAKFTPLEDVDPTKPRKQTKTWMKKDGTMMSRSTDWLPKEALHIVVSLPKGTKLTPELDHAMDMAIARFGKKHADGQPYVVGTHNGVTPHKHAVFGYYNSRGRALHFNFYEIYRIAEAEYTEGLFADPTGVGKGRGVAALEAEEQEEDVVDERDYDTDDPALGGNRPSKSKRKKKPKRSMLKDIKRAAKVDLARRLVANGLDTEGGRTKGWLDIYHGPVPNEHKRGFVRGIWFVFGDGYRVSKVALENEIKRQRPWVERNRQKGGSWFVDRYLEKTSQQAAATLHNRLDKAAKSMGR